MYLFFFFILFQNSEMNLYSIISFDNLMNRDEGKDFIETLTMQPQNVNK